MHKQLRHDRAAGKHLAAAQIHSRGIIPDAAADEKEKLRFPAAVHNADAVQKAIHQWLLIGKLLTGGIRQIAKEQNSMMRTMHTQLPQSIEGIADCLNGGKCIRYDVQNLHNIILHTNADAHRMLTDIRGYVHTGIFCAAGA